MTESLKLTPALVALLAEEMSAQVHFRPDTSMGPVLQRLGIDLLIDDRLSPGDAEVRAETRGTLRGSKIALPARSTADEDRFAVARAIGDLFLKTWDEANPIAGSAPQKPDPDRAFQFATSFLMPRRHFRRSFEEMGRNVGRLSKHFNLPPRVVEYRARELGMGGANGLQGAQS